MEFTRMDLLRIINYAQKGISSRAAAFEDPFEMAKFLDKRQNLIDSLNELERRINDERDKYIIIGIKDWPIQKGDR